MRLFQTLAGLTCITLMTACANGTDDLYDPTFNKELGISVPESFNWATTQTVKAIVEVNDAYNGKFYYAVRIYTTDPSQNANLAPIAAGVANCNEPYMEDITIPAATTTLYVSQVFKNYDGTEEVTTQAVPVSQMGSVKMGSIASRAGETGSNGATLASVISSEKTWVELTDGEFKPSTKTNYKVPAGTTVSITVASQAFKDCVLYVEPGATLNVDQKNNGQTFTVGVTASLYNDGRINVDGTTRIENGGKLYNNGCFYTTNFQADTNSKKDSGECHMYAYSYIECSGTFTVGKNAEIKMAPGSWINTKDFHVDGDDNTEIEQNGNDPQLGTTYRALLQITGNISAQNKNAICEIQGRLLVEYKGEQPSFISLKEGDKCKFTKDATQEDIIIAGTSCSGGFNNTETSTLTYTYGMEDQYPEKGDFDLNDVVVKIEAVKTKANGIYTQLDVNYTLMAVGATAQISGYVSLNGTEKTLFEDAHEFISGSTERTFINTDPAKDKIAAKSGIVSFQGLSLTTIDIAKDLKFYIRTNGGEPIYSAEQGGIISSNNQIIGGIRIPEATYQYPIEKTSITKAFDEQDHRISNWIANMSYATDWYKYPTAGKTYNK